MKQATLKLLLVLLATALEAYSLRSEKQGENKPQRSQSDSLKTWPQNLRESLLSLTYEDEAQTSHVYIVVFKQEATAQEIDLHKEAVKKMDNVGPILREYSIGNDFRGYSASMTKYDAEKIQNHRSVEYVEKSKDGQAVYWYCRNSQSGAPWGLVRSSRRNFNAKHLGSYIYSNNGRGSNVYVIDTGIDTSHPQFQGRAIWGTNTIDHLRTDDQGHGTHVAGTVISHTYGIAKGATAIAVRTCYKNNKGTATCPGHQTVDAVHWVANQHRQGSKSIINMSLEWKNGFRSLDDAVRAAIRKGIHVSVAAGNGWVDACTVSPARVAQAVTVGAININNAANYNYGRCIDINAPGVNVKSTLPNRRTGTWSGTSMAAPHVAGAMAVILQSQYLTPSQMSSRLVNVATLNQMKNLRPGTPNRILFIPCYS